MLVSSTSDLRIATLEPQGEPGAYSEKALRELLGPHVYATGKPTFEDAFKVGRQPHVV